MVSNFLPPDSQPWVRSLENKVKALETTIASLKKATTSRVSSAVTTPGNVLTLGGEKVSGEGVLNGSLEHLNGAYTLRYGHEFHGLTHYLLIVSGKASGAGELSLLGPEGQVLDSDTLEIDTDVEDATEFYFAVDFPILTLNYEFEPEDGDDGWPDTDQEVVSSYVLPDTGTLSLVTGASLDELSYEIRSANRSQVTIDTSSGVPTITGLSADGTTIDVMHDYSDTLEFLENALEVAQQELADARTEANQNFEELDDKLGQAFPDDIFDVNLAIEQAKDLSEQRFADAITGTVVEYARNTSETEAPTTGWSMTPPDRTPGSYVWMRTTITYGDGTPSVLAPALLTGNDGATGVSVSSIAPFFHKGTSKPSQPSGTGTPSGWTTTEPAYTTGTKLWRSERISFSNNTVQWTPVTEVATYAGIDAAMNMASGKNAVTYTDVANSASAPGPTPPTALGAGRRKYDMHRNRRMNGQIIGEWMWTGTAWTQLTLSDAMLSSLDVGKLTAGTGVIETAVINKLWGQLGVFDKLDVRTDAYVSGVNLKDGAVTSRTLNVVPEEGTGGVEILPPGIRIIPSDVEAGTAVSLRTDEENWIAFAKNGETTFSVDPDGNMVAESVEARQSLVYRDTELQESLNGFGRGIMAMARNFAPISIGSSEGRLLAVSFQVPSDNRMVEIRVMGRVSSSARRRAAIRLKQSDTGAVTPLDSTQKTWYLQTDWAESFDLSVTRSVGEWGWVQGDTVTVGVFVESLTAGESLSFSVPEDQEIIVKDAGPWLAIQGHAPWAPATGGGDGGGTETAPTPRAYTKSWTATGHRTYAVQGLPHRRAGQSVVQGYIPGTLHGSRGHWIFNDTNIRSELNGADITSGTLTIRNEHSYASSGMTAVLRYHNYSTAPSTFGASTAWTTVHVKRGGTVTVPLTATILNGLKAGTIRGFSLDAGASTSTTHYGYFSPSASLKINYKK